MTGAALIVTAFWLLLALPGYAVLRRLGPSWLAGGPLSGYALSCLASFALLTPVSVLGYALHLPIWVLTAAVVLAVAAAAQQLARCGALRLPAVRPSAVGVLASAIVAADALMGLRIGGHMQGDAVHHVARVRMLLAHGFNSLDPLVEGAVDPIYQGNLYHALIAAAAQITGVEAIEAWAYTLLWAKLAVAGAIHYLAFSVLRVRALAWIAAALFAVFMAPQSTLLYPNMLAGYGFVPLAIAFAVRVQLDEDRRQAAAGLGAVALATAQLHGLYYLYACMLVGPPLLVALLRTQLRHLPGRRELIAALLALALGLPWLVPSALARLDPGDGSPPAPALENAPRPPSDAEDDAERYRGFVRLPGDQIMFDPTRLWSLQSWDVQLLLAIGIGLLTQRRAALLAVSGSVLVLFAVLYVPPLCTAAADIAGAPWIVRRLSAAINVLWFAIAPGALLLLVRERFAPRWLELAALVLALVYAHTQGVDAEAWSRKNYFASALDPASLRESLEQHSARRMLFARSIPPGATVLSRHSDARWLTMDCDCYPLAFARARGSRGAHDIEARRWAAETLLATNMPYGLPERVAFLRRYRVAAMWLRGGQARELRKIYRPIIAREDVSGRDRVFVLDLTRAVP